MIPLIFVANLWDGAKFHYLERVEVTQGWNVGCKGVVVDLYPNQIDYDVKLKRSRDCKPESNYEKMNESELKSDEK